MNSKKITSISLATISIISISVDKPSIPKGERVIFRVDMQQISQGHR
ncbi:hypothetical protein HGQ85_11265 [Clostridioides difficile]|nr:hypothetical protein [Clostridioides difficile]